MSTNKLRIIKDYDKLDVSIQEQIKLTYPEGFVQHLITFTNKDGKLVSALPFETEDRIYLIRMNQAEASNIIDLDDDYDDDGLLKDDVKEEFETKYELESDEFSDDDKLGNDDDRDDDDE
jgi:hypothetical protein